MTKAATHNFHVPMSGALYDRLRKEAKESGRPATELARHAIEDFLEKRRKDVIHSAIKEFAERYAGAAIDLDEELESASVEHLAGGEKEAG